MASSEPSPKRAKLSKSIHSAPIKIVVGVDQIEYFASKHLICAQSDFFKAACNDRWESGRTNTVTLADTDSEIFCLFLTWLLTGNIEDAEELIMIASDDVEAEETIAMQQFLQFAKCFILGDELQCLTFCNYIMDQIIRNCQTDLKRNRIAGSDLEVMNYIYGNTMNDSHLRKVIIDNLIACFNFEEYSLQELDSNSPLPKKFYLELTQRLGTAWVIREQRKSVWADPCTYHKHPNEEHQASCTSNALRNENEIPPYLSILSVTPSWSVHYTLN